MDRGCSSKESTMANDTELEQRIRERAYQIWLDSGKPEGRDKEHWELARFAMAQQDGLASALLVPELPKPEPIEALINQDEFPTLTDQGEGMAPGEYRG